MSDSLVYILLIISVMGSGILFATIRPFFEKNIKLFLAFSGAFLLSISVTHIIPEVYIDDLPNIGIYVLLGFLIQLVLEYFSQGIEHGHVHVHKGKFPVVVLFSLCLHSFIEGMPLEREIHIDGHDHDSHSLFLGILLHKIPIAIALMSMLLKSGLNNVKALLWLFLFAIMAPLGTFVGHVLNENISEVSTVLDYIFAIVLGMFLHISTTILFETDEDHKFNFKKLTVIILGGVIAVIFA